MRKSFYIVGIATMIFVLASVSAGAVEFVTIGSGGVGGTYYPLGGSMAEVLSKADIGVKANSRSTAASKENCRLVASGKAEIGMSTGSTLWQAYNGVEVFEKDGKLPLRILMNMYPAPHHLVTTTKTGITKFEDIKGKKVSLGAPGGGDQILTLLILKAAGIDPEKDLNKQQLTQPEGATALKDGHIDAVFWNFAAPGSAVLEVAAVRDVVIVPFPQELVDKVIKDNPMLQTYTIKAGTYPKQDQDILTVADANFLVVHEKMSESLAYNLLKTLLDNKDVFMKVTPHASHFVPSEASIGIIPFADGAVKYFKEQGIEVK
ncbi:MAG: TRAP transporter substrate-binding protein [Dethiosulfovibrio peptidovorans]|nr:MAG: TRAP transporter substrate-binding protein [Dethiosulfovibrio peptidovorans]